MRERHTTALLVAMYAAGRLLEGEKKLTREVIGELIDLTENGFRLLLKGEAIGPLRLTPQEGDCPGATAWVQGINDDILQVIEEVEGNDATIHGYKE